MGEETEEVEKWETFLRERDSLTIMAWNSEGLMESTLSPFTSTIRSPTLSSPCLWMIPPNRMRAMIRWLLASFRVIPCQCVR